MRIAVLGTGANGAGVAADIIRSGNDLTLIDPWPENVEAIRRSGITVRMPERTVVTPAHAYHVCQVAELRQRFDVVFLLTKAYDTRWACALIAPLLDDDGVVVGLQNGMSADAIADIVGADRAIGGVIEVTAAMRTPGVSIRQSPPERSWFAVGGLSEASKAKAPAVAEILRSAGTVEVRDEIQTAKWMKLVVNCSELAPSALLGAPIVAVRDDPGTLEFSLEAGREAMRVGLAAGYRPVPVFGVDPADHADTELFADALLHAVHERYVLADSKSTVLQDWEKGRRSEVADINGRVASMAARLGLSAPVNARTASLAADVESGRLRPGANNASLMRI